MLILTGILITLYLYYSICYQCRRAQDFVLPPRDRLLRRSRSTRITRHQPAPAFPAAQICRAAQEALDQLSSSPHGRLLWLQFLVL
jgi:hypothetical protein